jgi:hypothetical protein
MFEEGSFNLLPSGLSVGKGEDVICVEAKAVNEQFSLQRHIRQTAAQM